LDKINRYIVNTTSELMRKPLIGISPGYAGPDPDRKFAKAGHINFVDLNYSSSVEAAGGLPIVLPHFRKDDNIKRLVEMIDGLVLIGGNDIHPSRYGQELFATEHDTAEERDEFEMRLLEVYYPTGKPILAICRGFQVLNVFLGGSMVQDIPAMIGSTHHFQEPGTLTPSHHVRLEDGCLAARLTGKTNVAVNSFHHQTLDRIAEPLRPVGYSDEGLVEVVEAPDHPFVLAVQWHPERMGYAAEQRSLFEGFIDACRESSVVSR
jgi:putative glutamine amidotransferase